MLIEVRERQRAGTEAKFAWAPVGDDVDGIEALAAAQGARNLFHGGHCAAEQHRGHSGPQSCDERRNICYGRIDEGDFPSVFHPTAPAELSLFGVMFRA